MNNTSDSKISPLVPNNKPSFLSIDGLKFYYLSYKGRLNRKRFILAQILLSVLFVPMIISMAEMMDEFMMIAPSPDGFKLPKHIAKQTFSTGPRTMGLFLLTAAIGYLLISHALAVKRFHDLGISGHLTILFFIPVAQFIALFMLYLVRGQDKDNLYGPNPLAKKGTKHTRQSSNTPQDPTPEHAPPEQSYTPRYESYRTRKDENDDDSSDPPPVVRRR